MINADYLKDGYLMRVGQIVHLDPPLLIETDGRDHVIGIAKRTLNKGEIVLMRLDLNGATDDIVILPNIK
jgi:hypothetical protein